ncbi:MAG: propionyl-CoA--succinate CoA transferase [Acidimicrobiales bacterium]|nr:propionyl-CoA--succinate CoA transferase [Acidimicrobiales bacterium]
MPLANGEPVALLDAIEAAASRLQGVRVHQMHALHDRRYLHGAFGDHLRHVSYFLSAVTRPAFHAGQCELVPNHFSEVPRLLRESTRCSLVLAAAAPVDRHGYFSLGTNCDYVAALIGHAPFFLEVNERMPRTFGGNQVHVSQVVGWTRADRPLLEVTPAEPGPAARRIAGMVAERIPDGATLQAGIGAVPNALLSALHGHRDLGVHTELLSDGFVELIESGAATGLRKRHAPGKAVTTFVLGTQRLYDFVHENPAVEFQPVNHVNDPAVIASEPRFVSVNATVEVDLLGQCASETVEGRYWSSSGGQADFARGAMASDGGRAFIVLPATARNGTVSRIRPTLTRGAVVTTSKNTVDHVVTEHGVAELQGRSIRQRATALIAIAAPEFRDELTAAARRMDYL